MKTTGWVVLTAPLVLVIIGGAKGTVGIPVRAFLSFDTGAIGG